MGSGGGVGGGKEKGEKEKNENISGFISRRDPQKYCDSENVFRKFTQKKRKKKLSKIKFHL